MTALDAVLGNKKTKEKDVTSMAAKDVTEKKMKRMTVEVPRELHTLLRQASIDSGDYIRDIVVEAVEEYLEKKGYEVKS